LDSNYDIQLRVCRLSVVQVFQKALKKEATHCFINWI